MQREKITAIIPTFNNVKIIRRCLESIKWSDEILIVDSFSTDKTLDICREYGARIIQHEYINSAIQKNWAIPQAEHEWILLTDSDEIVEPALRDEILKLLENPAQEIDAYRIPRKNYIYGVWMKYCNFYPDYNIRLFRRSCRYVTREVHADIDVPKERFGTLKNHHIHDDFNDMQAYLKKFTRYMRYETDELEKRGKKFRLREVILRPFVMFCYAYFYKRGYKGGLRGFMIAVQKAFYNFTMYMQLWERQYGKKELESWRKKEGFEEDK
jgi:glycosyltransferase involved in cell wall biosynthesis